MSHSLAHKISQGAGQKIQSFKRIAGEKLATAQEAGILKVARALHGSPYGNSKILGGLVRAVQGVLHSRLQQFAGRRLREQAIGRMIQRAGQRSVAAGRVSGLKAVAARLKGAKSRQIPAFAGKKSKVSARSFRTALREGSKSKSQLKKKYVKLGMSPSQAAKVAWATRRKKYGKSGRKSSSSFKRGR